MDKERNGHPNFISRLLFLWIAPLIYRGRRAALRQTDAPPFASILADGSGERGPAFLEQYAQVRLSRTKWRTLHTLQRMLGRKYLFAAAGKPFWLASALAQVFCVRALVSYVSSENAGSSERWKYLPLCFVLFLAALGMSLSQHAVFFYSVWCGTLAKSALISAMYRKASRLSAYDARGLGILHTVDSQRVAECAMYFHFVWFSIVELTATCALLFWVLGPAAAFGVLFMLATVPIQIYMSKAIAKARTNVAQYADERVGECAELLAGIRIVKLSCLEPLWASKIQDIRRNEVKALRRATALKAINSAVFFTIPAFVMLSSFCAYVFVFNRKLTPTVAFSAVGFFNVLARVLNMVPYGLIAISEVLPSLARLDNYFDLDELSELKADCSVEEHPDDDVTGSIPISASSGNPNEIAPGEEVSKMPRLVVLENCFFSWNSKDSQFESVSDKVPAIDHRESPIIASGSIRRAAVQSGVSKSPYIESFLCNISLQVRQTELVACIGPVGSGKSSLLLSVLKEMPRQRGKCAVYGRVAYCAQNPWILNATLRHNIVMFGRQEPVDEQKYEKALYACCLIPDLKLLPSGDNTEIGERGVTLSGGQKARVALARAVYADSDVYLLDDPLSAVDAAIATQLRHRVFGTNGVLSDKAVLLVTHQVSILPIADRVIVMESGQIKFDATFSSLQQMGIKFEGLNEDEADKLEIQNNNSLSEDWWDRDRYEEGVRDIEIARKSKEQGITTVVEDKRIGKVEWFVYLAYLKAAGGMWPVLLIAAGFLLSQAGRTGSDIWVGVWSADKISDRGDSFYALVCLCLISSAILFGVVRAILFSDKSTRASRKCHDKMLDRVLHAKPVFFEQTPTGRILNRFSSDVDNTDLMLPTHAQDFLQIVVYSIGALIAISVVLPWFLIGLLFIVYAFFVLQRLYLLSSRELKRLEVITRSPVYSHVVESAAGITSIRAFSAEQKFERQLDDLLDLNLRMYVTFQSTGRWLGTRLDFLSATAVFVTSFVTVVLSGSLNSGAAGVALTQSLTMTGILQWATRQAAECENDFTSVERIVSMSTDTPIEAAEIIEGSVSKEWPWEGTVEFDHVVMKYRPELEPSLRDVSFKLSAREKIGIVGRSGSGKSSLVAALFRMVEVSSGRICIDGVDISTVGLRDLRSRLSIVSQDPIVFTGTVRENLDPAGERSDAELLRALKRVQLVEDTGDVRFKLDMELLPGGSNMSAGERQLLTMARAILSRARCCVLDEATSAVDLETDSKIKAVVRNEFRDKTVMIIAHRLDTVIECDKILVMDGGSCVELGTPAELALKTDGIFSHLVNETGPQAASLRLRAINGTWNTNS